MIDSYVFLENIRQNIVGADYIPRVNLPFGPRKLFYCDYMATGRHLRHIEESIQEKILPLCGNPHSTCSWMSLQSTHLVEQARAFFRQTLHATEVDHAVLFTGNGATDAFRKLLSVLRLETLKFTQTDRPVVFLSELNHHSASLIFPFLDCDVVYIPLTHTGQTDMVLLRKKLEEYSDRRYKIGVFSHSSNVTGVIEDTEVFFD